MSKARAKGKLGTTIQHHSNNGGLFKNLDTAKFFTFNKSFVANLSFRLLQSLRLLSGQIISFVHWGYFSEHQVKTCLKNTSPRKCSEILTIQLEYTSSSCLYILPLTGYSYTGAGVVTGSFPPRCIKATQCAITAFSRTGVFERRFHLVFWKITSVCKR